MHAKNFSLQLRPWLAKVALLILLLSSAVPAVAESKRFEFVELDYFPTLDQFGSLEKFEAYIAKYETECLNWYGASTATSSCLMGYYIWDRELNIQYQALRKRMTAEQREQLKITQKQWLSARDELIKLNHQLLDQRYQEYTSGTMYVGMRAVDLNEMTVPMIRARALYLATLLKLMDDPVLG